MRLTETNAERAKWPVAGQRFLRDSEITGLALRVTPGAKSWVWAGRLQARRDAKGKNAYCRVTIGHFPDMSLAKARRLAMEIRLQVERGADPTEILNPRGNESTFEELIEAYFERHARPHKRERSIKDDTYYLDKYVPGSWRKRSLSAIGRDDVERLKLALKRDHGPYPANHTLRLLRCMFNLARDWGLLKGDNPAARVKLFKEERHERFLSPDELKRVNDALTAESMWQWRAYFPLALLLGLRKSELLSLRWDDVDLGLRTLKLPQTKAGRPHLLPLPSPAAAIFEGLPSRGQSEWVFSSDRIDGHIVEPSKAWQRIRERAGVSKVRIHDLRHTLASWLVAQGYNLPLIGRALNHSQTSTTERYAHLALDPVREALERNAVLMVAAQQSR
jgi:integrase